MKKFFVFVLFLALIASIVWGFYSNKELEQAKTELENLQIPDANTTDPSIGLVYLLGSSNVYENMDDAFQGKTEKGKLAQGDILSQVCLMGRRGYIPERIYGIRYDRVLTQEIPGKAKKTVYQVGELFIVPDIPK